MEIDLRNLLNRANFAHISTLIDDGSPQNATIWIATEGDLIVFATGEETLKAKNLLRDPRFAMSVVDFHNPYEEAQIRGKAVEFRDDSSLKVMDEISHKYTGKPFPFRESKGRLAIFLEIEKVKYSKLPFEHTPPSA